VETFVLPVIEGCSAVGVSLPEQRSNQSSGKGTVLLVLGGKNSCMRRDQEQERSWFKQTFKQNVCFV